MSNGKDFESTLNDFLESARSLENNIISTVSDANSDVEMVLRELLVYLNSTSKFLEEIQERIEYFNTQTAELSRIPSKIDEIPEKINGAVDKQTKQLYSVLKKINDANYKVLTQTHSYAKHVYNMIKEDRIKTEEREEKIDSIYNSIMAIEKQLQQTNKSVNENQDNLMKIITEFMNLSKTDKTTKAQTEQTKIQAEVEEKKQKVVFWTKVISVLAGSGGILYLVIDSIIKAIGS